MKDKKITRRKFLTLSAVGMAGAIVGSCSAPTQAPTDAHSARAAEPNR